MSQKLLYKNYISYKVPNRCIMLILRKKKKVDGYSDLSFPSIVQDVPNLNVKISGMRRKSILLCKKVL